METTLHRELKTRYAASIEQTEITYGDFRIDAIGDRGELVEIQHASLGALRTKVSQLLATPRVRVRVVKPIIARKWLIMLDEASGQVVRRRLSPKRGTTLDLFLDLVHFTTVFPHPRLTLEIVLVDVEEVRVPRKRPTRRGKNYRLVDQKVVEVVSTVELRSNRQLWDQIPDGTLSTVFDSAQLAEALDRPRWFAQKVAFCLRETGAAKIVGKRGNSQLYKACKSTRCRAA